MPFLCKSTISQINEMIRARNTHFDTRVLAQHLRQIFEQSYQDNAARLIMLKDIYSSESVEDLNEALSRYTLDTKASLFVGSAGHVWSVESLIGYAKEYFARDHRSSGAVLDPEDIEISGQAVSAILEDLECIVDSQGLLSSATSVIANNDGATMIDVSSTLSSRLSCLDTATVVGPSIVKMIDESADPHAFISGIISGVSSMCGKDEDQSSAGVFPKVKVPSDVSGKWGIIAAFNGFSGPAIFDAITDVTENVIEGVLGLLLNLVDGLCSGVSQKVDQGLMGRSVKKVSNGRNFNYPWLSLSFDNVGSRVNSEYHPSSLVPYAFGQSASAVLSVGKALHAAYVNGRAVDDPNDAKLAHIFLQSDTIGSSRYIDVTFDKTEAEADYNTALYSDIATHVIIQTRIDSSMAVDFQGVMQSTSQYVSDPSYSLNSGISSLKHLLFNNIFIGKRKKTITNNNQPNCQVYFLDDFKGKDMQVPCGCLEISGVLLRAESVELAEKAIDDSYHIAIRHGHVCSISPDEATHLIDVSIPRDILKSINTTEAVYSIRISSNGTVRAYVSNFGGSQKFDLQSSSILGGAIHVFQMFAGRESDQEHVTEGCSIKMYINARDKADQHIFRYLDVVAMRWMSMDDGSFSFEVPTYVHDHSESHKYYPLGPVKSIKYINIDSPHSNRVTSDGVEVNYQTAIDTVSYPPDLSMVIHDVYLENAYGYNPCTIGSDALDIDRYLEQCSFIPQGSSEIQELPLSCDVDFSIVKGMLSSRLDWCRFMRHQFNLVSSVAPRLSSESQVVMRNTVSKFNSLLPSDRDDLLKDLNMSHIFKHYSENKIMDVNAGDINPFDRYCTHSNRSVAGAVCCRYPTFWVEFLAFEDALSILMSWVLSSGALCSTDFSAAYLYVGDPNIDATGVLDYATWRSIISFPTSSEIVNKIGYDIRSDADNADSATKTLVTVAGVMALAYFGIKIAANMVSTKALYNSIVNKPLSSLTGGDLSLILRRRSKRSNLIRILSKFATGIIPKGFLRSEDELSSKAIIDDLSDLSSEVERLKRIIGNFDAN